MAFTAQLPRLPEVERVSGSILRVLGGNPSKYTLQGTNTYILGNEKSRQRILIDTAQGFPSWAKLLESTLKQEQATISTCLITHWHHDHVGGINDLRRLCPEVQIWKHTPRVWDGEQSERAPADLKVDDVKTIEDGMVFVEAGIKLRASHCPGHTVDHCAFIIEESGVEDEKGAIFTGDNVLGHGTSVFSSLSEYMSSLGLMSSSLPSDRVVKAFPAHGAVIENGKAKIEEYIHHRHEREEEILAAFGDGETDMTPMQIVKIVYKEYPENLHEPAEKGVKQVLAKLAEDQKVKRDGLEWSLSQKASDGAAKAGL